ncbi:hypothetical protein [Natronorubrum texcoconense]|nr:hypothetical protein [Natronorubrum texcoconense]
MTSSRSDASPTASVGEFAFGVPTGLLVPVFVALVANRALSLGY